MWNKHVEQANISSNFQGFGDQETHSPGFNSFKHLKHLHAHLLRFGLCHDNYLLNMILRCSFDFSDTNYTRFLFHQIKQPNIFLWNTMIRGLVSNDCFDDAIEFYVGCEDPHLVVKGGFDCDVFVKTSLVCLYAKCGYLEDAPQGKPSICFGGCWEMNLAPDSFTIVRVLSACTQLGDLNSGEWIHKCIMEMGMVRNVFVGTSLVDMYAKCGNMEKARSVFDGMPEKDIVSWGARFKHVSGLEVFKGMKEKDRVVWNAIISGLAMNGYVKISFGLFGQVEKLGIKPDGTLSLACFVVLLMLVWLMRAGDISIACYRFFSLTPSIEHYGCMVDLLGRAGLLDEAHQLIRNMPMEANAIVWGALLGACRIHRDTQLAELALKQLID
ncbi:putative pentatricopeptide repeat-containing protein [Vitis vinifera]|uniref:Putative pentatricopeptide repeat-containing protein n=1 Tax=Vitis vinifera TaxID=29760 RepID=A0A438FV44_VITVI|nr:putative pentatricopeptide repeat-containing protein [Vitis vinifera]